MQQIQLSEGVSRMQEGRYSTRRSTRCIHGCPREVTDHGFGKSLNMDLDRIHAIDT
ncbi:hypothetical protein H9X85_02700 [Anaerotignum lactatifermentans]|uniref:Uncharacterized protein n=1 Tax=Anaerotignum lactatifermentans TaxID=160404 RepID=A0ABS2GA83_9FIRM|nr:hypothetical protein [Anaerotignum lactatifermentans]MBM6828543.1 hypothetical protein [Anaerotignum lactatifermentans]MBM6877950.1 hypothetical protein [Anaerotignum lactatifermentans]MBM6950125.1 hypothetical protein [Anaerotignum lactatifermentans]